MRVVFARLRVNIPPHKALSGPLNFAMSAATNFRYKKTEAAIFARIVYRHDLCHLTQDDPVPARNPQGRNEKRADCARAVGRGEPRTQIEPVSRKKLN